MRRGPHAAGDLPEDVRSVGRQVREIAPSLRKAGVDIRPRRTGKRRALRISKIKSTAPAKTPSPLPENKKRNVTNVTIAASPQVSGPEKGDMVMSPDVTHVTPAAALMSLCPTWDITVPPSAQVSRPEWDVCDVNPGPFLTWLSPPTGPAAPGGGGCLHPAAQLADGRPYRRASRRHCGRCGG